MSEIRAEVQGYIDNMSDYELTAIRPILSLLVDEPLVIETDLTEEEKEIIRQGREEYKKGGYVSLKEGKRLLRWSDNQG